MTRNRIPLPKNTGPRILSLSERQYLANRHYWHLRFTPKFWRDRYIQVWSLTWFLGKAALVVFFLAIGVMIIALIAGVK